MKYTLFFVLGLVLVLCTWYMVRDKRPVLVPLSGRPCWLIDGNRALNADATTTEAWERWCFTLQAEYEQHLNAEDARSLHP